MRGKQTKQKPGPKKTGGNLGRDQTLQMGEGRKLKKRRKPLAPKRNRRGGRRNGFPSTPQCGGGGVNALAGWGTSRGGILRKVKGQVQPGAVKRGKAETGQQQKKSKHTTAARSWESRGGGWGFRWMGTASRE